MAEDAAAGCKVHTLTNPTANIPGERAPTTSNHGRTLRPTRQSGDGRLRMVELQYCMILIKAQLYA